MTGFGQSLVFDHLRGLTDERGLFEHADRATPRPEHGYCVDDASRALVLVCRTGDPALEDLAERYLEVTRSAVAADGRCHNRLGLDGRWLDEPGLGDWWGRAVWALGVAAVAGPTSVSRRRALTGFRLLAQQRPPHRRSLAFAALGAAELARSDDTARSLLEDAAAAVVADGMPAAERARLRDRWPWPERRLAYANARLPEALLAAGDALDRPELTAQGLTWLRFLLSTETYGGHFSVTPVGGRGPGEHGPAYDQQPIEVAGLADACARAYELTRDETWRHGVGMARGWFLGDNDGRIEMYDPASGAGYDGLVRGGRNLNRGAESTLAALFVLHQAGRTGAIHEP